MEEQFIRTARLIGEEGVALLRTKTVAVFGLGGVGSFAAEALVRAGIHSFILVDHDTVSISNLNRQLIALHSTLGKRKTDVMKERMLDIYPGVKVICKPQFFSADNQAAFGLEKVDYIVDAIDTVASKIALITFAKEHRIPMISCMGTGNKIDASLFEITDISKTSVCPLARAVRLQMKKRGLSGLKVLYSKENSYGKKEERINAGVKQIPASISFVPPVAGMLLAGEVVRDLLLPRAAG